MNVLKFGGTSVGDVRRMREAAAIVLGQDGPCVVVVSAVSGVTNALLEAGRSASRGARGPEADALTLIRARHQTLLAGLEDDVVRHQAEVVIGQRHEDLTALLDRVRVAGAFSDALSDAVVSIGEKCSSVIFAGVLRERGIDATYLYSDRANLLATDGRFGNARPDRVRTRANCIAHLKPLLEAGQTVVVTGFIGTSPDGETTTLGRGGSDYSATLLGAALDAGEIQIWTDVPGVLSADPRSVPAAQVVPEISYEEAQELAHFGARVLHPRTIRPAVARNIPVRILSTFAPAEPGTVVVREAPGERIKAVTALKGLILLTLDVPELEDMAQAASCVFRVMSEHSVEILTVSQASSRRRMTYLVDAVMGGCTVLQERLAEALLRVDIEAEVTCAEHVAVVAAVGEGAAGSASVLAQMLAVLHRNGIPVLSTNQQTSNVAMLAVVAEEDAGRAVDAVHEMIVRPAAASARSRRRRRNDLMAESLRVG